jgi:hypothetical protein
MPTPVNFGLEFALSLLVSILLVKWYAWPYLREKEFSVALLLLLSPFLVRYLGLILAGAGRRGAQRYAEYVRGVSGVR